MRRLPSTIMLAIVTCALPSAAGAATYTVDRNHSTIGFKIRHLFSNVRGQFNEFTGTVNYTEGQPETWAVTATAQAASIDTNVADRDTHLRSADFFDVEQFPEVTFTSTKVTDATEHSAMLEGLLTLHGVQRPVSFDLTIHGEGHDPRGQVRAGFSARTTIDRKAFGLSWNKAVETGQLLVGEQVEVELEIEAIKQAD